MNNKDKKIGLALGSGAARGLAHIGVLDILDKEGIKIDMIAGTSMGAFIGALYAQSIKTNEIKKIVEDWTLRKFRFMLDPTLSRTHLIRGRKIDNMLRTIIGNKKFEDLKIPLACIAADIWTGEEVAIRDGLVWEAVKASGTIPVILEPTRQKGRHLVDGAIANPLPVSTLKEMGANFIIAVNITPSVQDRLKGNKINNKSTEQKEPNIINVIMQLVHIINYRGLQRSLIEADIVIEPQVAHIGWSDFRQADEFINQGRLATRTSLTDIKRKLLA
jgi:NTE family protein